MAKSHVVRVNASDSELKDKLVVLNRVAKVGRVTLCEARARSTKFQ